MKKIVATAGISLLAGIAMGAWLGGDDEDDTAASMQAVDTLQPKSAATEDRLLRLEQVIAEEREARIALEDTLALLFEEIERLDGAGSRDAAQRQAETERRRERASQRSESRSPADWMRNYQERRVGRMVEGGFSEDEARHVLQKESEAAFKAMQASWEAQRNGDNAALLNMGNNPQTFLRNDIGDDAYARYLEAQGQPTSIGVTQVMSGSPGSTAGLQVGDQVVSYNGQRVFDVADLRNQTMQGDPGEDVVIEVDRDGMRIQLTVPRGPIGITGSGASVRGMNWWGG
jgi:C-terminal processing protease CtpA/Prc